jgi:hypothetical protein
MVFFIICLFGICIQSGAIAAPELERLEVVTNDAATGDGGNSWGGHQTRIVRTRHGVFVPYSVDIGQDQYNRGWRLARRVGDNNWDIIAEGEAGREPVNILAGPNDELYLFAWPQGIQRLWTFTFDDNGDFTVEESVVPGDWNESTHHYAGAGITSDGNICYHEQGGGYKPGSFKWAYYTVAENIWTFYDTPIDYSYC